MGGEIRRTHSGGNSPQLAGRTLNKLLALSDAGDNKT